MSDSDVTKMKVADLKRELKLRGLSATGNKNELMERLQAALIDGELSLEDTAISGEDLLDEDVLTDEEKEILETPTDEKDLLESPVSEKKSSPEKSPKTANEIQPRKIVLKRKTSITSPTSTSSSVAKENTEPPTEKILKMSQKNPITSLDSATSTTDSAEDKKAVKVVTQLTMKERLELRAKKFGLDESAKTISSPSVVAPVAEKDEKQIEALKKRAERFGVVVAPTMVNIKEAERLQKRKERFGIAAADDSSKTTAASLDGAGSDTYAEKARLRIERFKTAAK